MRSAWVMVAVGLAVAGCGGTPLIGGTGGAPGQSSGGGAGSALCDRLQAQYASALSAALACAPGLPNQCQTPVGSTPSDCPTNDCGNLEYVNDDTQVQVAGQRWLQACGPSGLIGCPYRICAPPLRTCIPTSAGASTGTCTTVPVSAPDGGQESCDQLAADYAATLQAALFCTPGAPYQCQGEAITEAVCDGFCPYVQPVNDSTPTQGAYQRWSAQCGGACNRIICNGTPQPTGLCVAVDGGSPTGGICVAKIRNLGTGTGGTSGSDGGQGGAADAGETCDQLMADYALAVNAALACTPGAPNQCEAAIDPMPYPCMSCGGTQAANDATGLSAMEQRWRAQCEPNVTCSVSGCNPPPVPGTCVAVNGGGFPGNGICLNRPRDAGN